MANVPGFQKNVEGPMEFPLDYSLKGKKFHLCFDSGEEEFFDFVGGEDLIRYYPNQQGVWLHYGCVTLHDTLHLIAYSDPNEIEEGAYTLILDEETGLVTKVKTSFGTIVNRPDLADCQYTMGTIKEDGKPLSWRRHCPTTELTGKKIAWYYPGGFINVHIYRDFYCRCQALQRPEAQKNQPLIDDPIYEEPCRYFKLRDGVYLMSNIEDHMNRRNPDAGGNNLLLIIDTNTMSDIGRHFVRRPAGAKRRWRLFHTEGKPFEGTLETELAPSPNTI